MAKNQKQFSPLFWVTRKIEEKAKKGLKRLWTEKTMASSLPHFSFSPVKLCCPEPQQTSL